MNRPRLPRGDLDYLGEALSLARRGSPSPNPRVGAVLVRGGRVVGRGHHVRAGAPHAEVIALGEAGAGARGATLYVSLEPCCHFGRTPPCVDAIISAGVTAVVACMRDPDPRVNGKGFRRLRTAGVRVRVGALASEARRQNDRFLRYARTGRPFVTLKAGMSLDGRIATRLGDSRWITSARSRAAARALRRRHDAVMVGVNTVLADDPRLTAPREVLEAGGDGRRGPTRVVLDSRLRTPPDARLLRGARQGGAVIMTLPNSPAPRRRRLERAGALVLAVAGSNGRVGLRHALAELGRRGVNSVLIEGGGEVLGSALDERVGDRIVLFVSASLLGGRGGRSAFEGEGAARLRDAVEVVDLTATPLDRDLVIEGRLRFGKVKRRRS